MTMQIQPKPGFDWSHITWGKPDSPVSAICSYCSAGISEEAIPLRLWRGDGTAAQFCDACQAKWWGMQTFDDAPFEDADSDDEDDDLGDEAEMSCGLGPDGQCALAGTEWCDWDCPFSEERETE